jgi:plasmid stabilization system protein ParE
MSRRRRFFLTPEARADLIGIWDHIAEHSIDGADQACASADVSKDRQDCLPVDNERTHPRDIAPILP